MTLKFTELGYQIEAINKTVTAIFENSNQEEFSIEMETGTGKTYTYIRTIFELYRQKKFSKFIIVAPSIAVREGIKKSFENLASHLQQKYSSIIYDVYCYNSKKLKYIESFCDKETLQILIIGIHGFNKDTNILKQNRDGLYTDGVSGNLFQSEKYIDKIANSNPIVIIDEPQMMDAEKSQEAITSLNPKFILKYSATHKNLKYEPVYKLTPNDAYEKRLVKQVEYYGVYIKHGFGVNAKFIKSEQKGKKWIATILENGKEKKVKDGDKIGNFKIERVLPNDILFDDGSKISQIKLSESDDFQLRREQIKRTIQIHEQKKKRLNDQGIKVLSLFFIDSVPNFDKLRGIFEEELACENLQSKYASYFSDKSTTKGIENDEEKIELIMRHKERLLSLEEPVEYIFTHSALGVGWDCPNVFQICFLRDIGSDISRRQFIGRGLRLAVNQSGDRIMDGLDTPKDEIINLLTVIGGEKWDEFVKNYQEDCKKDGVMAVPIKDGSTPKQIMKIRKEKLDEAKVLWSKIATKSKYLVHFDDKEKLYENIIRAIKSFESEISAPQILVEKAGFTDAYNANIEDAAFGAKLESKYDRQEVIRKICEETWLTKWEVNKILAKCDENAIKKNQQMWLSRAVDEIEKQIQNAIITISRVEYQLTDEKWNDKAFYDDEKPTTAKTETADKSLYDFVEYDSVPEQNFIKLADDTPAIKLFMKLPKGGDRKFHINTPIGKYFPDFAVIVGENDKLYMVFEVKDRASYEVTPEEEFKIKCAIEHFRALGFDVETTNINSQTDILTLENNSFRVYDGSNKI